MVKVGRITKETTIAVELHLDAPPPPSRTKARATRAAGAKAHDASAKPAIVVSTTMPFYDHMLTTLLRYAGIRGSVQATGDLRHHIVEDVAIAIGRAVRELVPAKCARYGHRAIPMDDALVLAAVDVGGRYFFAGSVPNALHTHAMRSFAEHLGASIHVRVLAGTDRHHQIEAGWKAIGLALRDAMVPGATLFSTKGSIEWTIATEGALEAVPPTPGVGG